MDNDQTVGAATLESLLLHEKRAFPWYGSLLHPTSRRRVAIILAAGEAIAPLA